MLLMAACYITVHWQCPAGCFWWISFTEKWGISAGNLENAWFQCIAKWTV